MVGDVYTTPAAPEDARYFDCGGNMDFPEVSPGNTLYLPVRTDGALLVLGDVHAFQGDGELFGEGGECAAEVQVTIDIEDNLPVRRPLVETPEAFVCLACRDTLFDGIALATKDMVALIGHVYRVHAADAYVACAMLGSLRVAGCWGYRPSVSTPVLLGLSVPKDLRQPRPGDSCPQTVVGHVAAGQSIADADALRRSAISPT
jgi:acetamidase/formamidase